MKPTSSNSTPITENLLRTSTKPGAFSRSSVNGASFALALVAGILAFPLAARADFTWSTTTGGTITEGGGTWQVGVGNWWDGAADQVWADGNKAILGTGTAGTAGTVTLGGDVSATAINTEATAAGAYTLDLDGNTLSVTTNGYPGWVINNSATVQNGTINWSGSHGVRATGTTTTVDAFITGSGGFAFLGAGRTEFTNDANSFAGNLYFQNGGVMEVTSIGDKGAPSAAGAGTRLQFFNGANLDYSGASDSTTNKDIQFGGASNNQIDVTGAGSLVISGGTMIQSATTSTTLTLRATSSTGNEFGLGLVDPAGFVQSVTKTGAGAWKLSGTNTYSGTTRVNAGILEVGGSGSLTSTGGSSSTTAPLKMAGGELLLSAGATITINDDAPGGGTTNVTSADLGGVLNVDGGSLVVQGQTAGSDTVQFNGEVTIGGGGTVFSVAAGQVITNGSAIFNINNSGASITMNNLNLVGGRTATLNFKLDAAGVSPIVNVGFMGLSAATLNVDGSDYEGGVGSIPLLTSNNLTSGLLPENIDVFGLGGEGVDWTITQDEGNNNDVILNILTDPNARTWDGSGDMTWTNPDSNSWSGDTYANGDNANFLGDGAGAVTISGTIEPGSITVLSTNDYTFSGDPIGGTTGLSKSGSGILTLASANTYTGVTTVSEGRLAITNAASLGTTAGNTVVTNAAAALGVEGGISVAESLDLAGNGGGTGALSSTGNNTVSGAITMTSSRIETVDGTGKLILTGGVAGSGGGNILVGDIQVDSLIDLGANGIQLAGSGINYANPGFDTGNVINLNVAGNNWDSALLFFDANVKLGVNDAIATDSTMSFGFSAVNFSTAQLDLSGFNQTLASIETQTLGVGGDVNITGSGTLTLNQDTNTEYQGRLTGGLSLVKNGTGTLTLNNLSGTPTSNTGNTTVGGGVLSMSSADLADASTVSIATGAALNLTHGVIDDVAVLEFNGLAQADGTYNAGNSGGFITGFGSIRVGGATGGYNGWAVTNAGGQTPEEDFDGDGVENGVEFFLDAPAGFTANPGLVAGTVTWANGGNIDSGQYGTEFLVQTSSDLSNWADVLLANPNLSNTAGSVSYTPVAAAPFFIRLVVTPALP